MNNPDEEEEEETVELEVSCSICYEETDSPMVYQCCKQISCKTCYTTMRTKHDRKECPYCRHSPIHAIRTPLKGGVRKRKRRREPGFLINCNPVRRVVREILKERSGNDEEPLQITKGAFRMIRRLMEQEAIQKMRMAQLMVEMRGGYTVMSIL